MNDAYRRVPLETGRFNASKPNYCMSPTGRLNPLEPEMQFIPIQPNPQEEEYLRERSIIERSLWALAYGFAIEEYNKHFIENAPDFSHIERRVLEVSIGYSGFGQTFHIPETPFKALCGRMLDGVYTRTPVDELRNLRICKQCLKKYEKTLAHSAKP